MAKICKILLVEDQHEIQDLLRELFASEGYRFIIVGDGAAMRRALDRDAAIDVVIVDVLLPGGVDGLMLAEEAAARGLPAVLVTGDHMQSDRLKASGHPHLLKPFPLAAFVTLIDDVLRTTQARCERDPTTMSRFSFGAAQGEIAIAPMDAASAPRRKGWQRLRQWLTQRDASRLGRGGGRPSGA